MASHAVLQYLPVVVSQVQIGCAHFFAGLGVMPSSCFAQRVFDAGSIMDDSRQQCCPLTDTFEVRSHGLRLQRIRPALQQKDSECQFHARRSDKAKKTTGGRVWPPVVSSFGFRCEKEKQLIGEKNGINDVNHAIRLVDVRNGNSGHAALFVRQHDSLALQARCKRTAADGLQRGGAIPGFDRFP
jgi:hypothetical protein